MSISILQTNLELREAELLLIGTQQGGAELEYSPGPSFLYAELQLQSANLTGQPLSVIGGFLLGTVSSLKEGILQYSSLYSQA